MNTADILNPGYSKEIVNYGPTVSSLVAGKILAVVGVGIRFPSSHRSCFECSTSLADLVPGLQRGLKVLETPGASEKPLSLSDIARAIGASRSSAFPLVYALRQMES